MSVRRRLVSAMQRHVILRRAVLLLPGWAWLLLFFFVPLGIVASYAFRPRHILGGVYPGWTLVHVQRLLDPLYVRILGNSILMAAIATALALLFAYPMALLIVQARRWRTTLLFLVVLPFWTSFLVRTYATIFLLRDTGLINQVLLALGVIHQPIQMLYSPGAVLFGLITGYLPFMVLPIYASLEKIDPALHEAAEVLGAGEWRRFLRVTWPLARPGVLAGGLMVFVPMLGSFLVPDLLGGARVVLIGNLIESQFTGARNWPFGSALSFLLLGVVLLSLVLRLRVRDTGAPA